VLGIEVPLDSNVYGDSTSGSIAFGPEKVAAFRNRHPQQSLLAISDSPSDQPLLKMATHGGVGLAWRDRARPEFAAADIPAMDGPVDPDVDCFGGAR
jgi:phosphoserine phosphatase